jgi:hypothetical protein
MFERNTIDNVPQVSAIPVEITLVDGTVVKGKLLAPAAKAVADVLNASTGFVDFEPYGGERSYIAKSQLASVRPVGIPKAPGLQARTRDIDGFDPHAVLGIARNAGRIEIREAYLSLAKTYHPDRYAAVELPREVRDYLDAMSRRINAAFSALDVPEKRKAVREEAVFTSPSR